MSERLVIRCPGCDRKLGLKHRMLDQQIMCPGCGTILKARASKNRSSDSGDADQRRMRGSGSSSAAAQEASSSPGARRSGRSSSKSRSGSNPSKQKHSSSRRKAKPAPAPIEDEFADNEWNERDDAYEDYGDDFSDELYADDGDESWMDDGYGEDWNSPEILLAAPQKKKTEERSAGSTRKKKRKSKRDRSTAGPASVLVWVGAGLIAALISVGLTIGIGSTGVWFLLVSSGIINGGLIGGSIRATTGSTDGWVPGLTAVAILLPTLFFGRVGAFYFNPSLMGVSGEREVRTDEQIQQDIDRQSSKDAMIVDIVKNELISDDRWMSENNITEVEFYTDTDGEAVDEGDIPYDEQYNEIVWAEGARRWNEIPEADRTERMRKRRQELKRAAGMISKEELRELVDAATSDEAMTERVAQELQKDKDWISASQLYRRNILSYADHADTSTEPKQRYHPVVWKAAAERWNGMDGQKKAEMRTNAESEIRVTDETDEDVKKKIFMLHSIKLLVPAMIATIYSLLMPFLYLGCTISAIGLAFSVGSGLQSG